MKPLTRLRYLEAMGIDVWVQRTPVLAVSTAVAADTECLASTELAAPPSDLAVHWATLAQEVKNCQACGLCQSRTQTVFGVGAKTADWLLIGEAPGQSEDQMGEPFVGKAGQLLNEMLLAMGLQRDSVYIANMLKCRPPNNRDPQADEIAACSGFLQRQIALIQPKIILAVGRIAAQNLLQQTLPLSKLRGQVYQIQNIPLTIVHHPSYLLRSPLEKRKAWEDLQFAVAHYRSLTQRGDA